MFYILEFYNIFIYSLFSLGLSIIIVFISVFLIFQIQTFEKLTAYECGFEAFEPSRERFEIQYYIVGLLFIIFDLEIIFLVPSIFSIQTLGFFGVFSISIFLLILTLGFIYEWLNKALDWPRQYNVI